MGHDAILAGRLPLSPGRGDGGSGCLRASVRARPLFANGRNARSFARTDWAGTRRTCVAATGAFTVAYLSWHAAFIALGVYGVIAFLWVLFYYVESRPDNLLKNGKVLASSATLSVIKSRRFRAWTAMLIATYCTLFCFLLSSGFVYIKVFGFSPLACGLTLAANSISYIGGTYWCRYLLKTVEPDKAVRLGAMFAVAGAIFMTISAFALGTPQPWAMIIGQCLIAISHGVNQPCGQAGAIGDFPEHAGRAAALSGFGMMVAAFICGQLIAPSLGSSAWPLIASNVAGSAAIAFVAWIVVPRAYGRSAAA